MEPIPRNQINLRFFCFTVHHFVFTKMALSFQLFSSYKTPSIHNPAKFTYKLTTNRILARARQKWGASENGMCTSYIFYDRPWKGTWNNKGFENLTVLYVLYLSITVRRWGSGRNSCLTTTNNTLSYGVSFQHYIIYLDIKLVTWIRKDTFLSRNKVHSTVYLNMKMRSHI